MARHLTPRQKAAGFGGKRAMRKSSSYAKKKSVRRKVKRTTTSTRRSTSKLKKTNKKGGTIGVIANNAAVNDLIVGGIGALLGYTAGNLTGSKTNPVTSVVGLAKSALGGTTGKDPVMASTNPDVQNVFQSTIMPLTATFALPPGTFDAESSALIGADAAALANANTQAAIAAMGYAP